MKYFDDQVVNARASYAGCLEPNLMQAKSDRLQMVCHCFNIYLSSLISCILVLRRGDGFC